MIENIKTYFNFLYDKIKSNRNLVIFILATILLWKILKNNFILILALGYLIWMSQKYENFDETGTVFADIGEPKYDLKGNRLYFHPLEYDIPKPRLSCCGY